MNFFPSGPFLRTKNTKFQFLDGEKISYIKASKNAFQKNPKLLSSKGKMYNNENKKKMYQYMYSYIHGFVRI